MSRQGHNVGRKCVPHTPPPSRQGRNAGIFQHIPSLRDGTSGGRICFYQHYVPTGHEIEPLHAIYFACLINPFVHKTIYELRSRAQFMFITRFQNLSGFLVI
jgi:hypothetical protein